MAIQCKYRLIKDYPNHKIGDIAVYDPEINELNFIWEKRFSTPDDRRSVVPVQFQPDVTPEWFEEVE